MMQLCMSEQIITAALAAISLPQGPIALKKFLTTESKPVSMQKLTRKAQGYGMGNEIMHGK
jgi:hypothetical protein